MDKVKNFFVDGWKFIKTYCENNQQQALGIAIAWIALVAVILLVAAIIVFFFQKKVRAVAYGKEDFVHKVLRYNSDIKNQLLAAASIALVITATICYFAQANPWVTLGFAIAVVVALALRIAMDLHIKFARVEYNNRGIYSYKVFGHKEIEWPDVKQVLTEGQGSGRKLIFIAKNNRKIKVRMNMEGAYEFGNFCEKQFKGKDFESIKIMQARQ